MAEPTTRTNEPFPKAARKLVARDGRTLRELAEALPYSHQHLHHFLQGKRTPRPDQIEFIAELLGVPGAYFREVRVERIKKNLLTNQAVRERLWEELRLRRD